MSSGKAFNNRETLEIFAPNIRVSQHQQM